MCFGDGPEKQGGVRTSRSTQSRCTVWDLWVTGLEKKKAARGLWGRGLWPCGVKQKLYLGWPERAEAGTITITQWQKDRRAGPPAKSVKNEREGFSTTPAKFRKFKKKKTSIWNAFYKTVTRGTVANQMKVLFLLGVVCSPLIWHTFLNVNSWVRVPPNDSMTSLHLLSYWFFCKAPKAGLDCWILTDLLSQQLIGFNKLAVAASYINLQIYVIKVLLRMVLFFVCLCVFFYILYFFSCSC